MALKLAVPDISEPVVDRATGYVRDNWYRFFELFETQLTDAVATLTAHDAELASVNVKADTVTEGLANARLQDEEFGNALVAAGNGVTGGGSLYDAPLSLALDVAFSPTWTGKHTFAPTPEAAPTALSWAAQSVLAGTSNTPGANWTFKGSRGTGTGVGGGFVFQVAKAGSTGTAQNALATAFTVSGYGVPVYPAFTVATLPAAANVPYGRAFVTDGSTTLILGLGTTVAGGGANKLPVYSDGTNWIIG